MEHACNFLLEKSQGKGTLGHLNTQGRIILKCILENLVLKVGTVLTWL
jgi:hypothetical protein